MDEVKWIWNKKHGEGQCRDEENNKVAKWGEEADNKHNKKDAKTWAHDIAIWIWNQKQLYYMVLINEVILGHGIWSIAEFYGNINGMETNKTNGARPGVAASGE